MVCSNNYNSKYLKDKEQIIENLNKKRLTQKEALKGLSARENAIKNDLANLQAELQHVKDLILTVSRFN